MVTFKIPQRLDANNAGQVEQQLAGLVKSEKHNGLICDFSETIYVSSAGLRIMLFMTKQLRQSGGSLILCAMQPQVFSIFKMAGFDTILDIRDSADQAPPTSRTE